MQHAILEYLLNAGWQLAIAGGADAILRIGHAREAPLR